MMQAEGLDAIFARHRRHTEATRAAAKALGLSLFAPDGAASPAITAIESDSAEAIRSAMRKKFDIALAGGQDHLKGKVFRIGHLGFVCDRDILSCVGALEATLMGLGHSAAPGAGVAAASKVLCA
jgi:aspartate aminotransferase-like enzyme